MAKQKKSFLPEAKAKTTLEWLWANGAFESQYPALYELLAAGVWDGEPRRGATLTLWCGDGRLKACLVDRHTNQALWVDLEATGDVLKEVEGIIQAGKHPWKPKGKGDQGATF